MKTLQSKPRTDTKGGSLPKPLVLNIDQDVTAKESPTTDHQHCSHTLQTSHALNLVPSEDSPASFTQPPSQSYGHCSDFSTDVQPPHHRTSVMSQQNPSTRELVASESGVAQRADCAPNSTDQRRYELHLPMTMDLYSSIERWEAQTPAEDVWSTFVVLEKGARKLTGEGMDVMREVAIEDVF
jgi:hypothetical protein